MTTYDPALVAAIRNWLKDYEPADAAAAFADLPDFVEGVAMFYDGGVAQFVKDNTDADGQVIS